MAELIAHLFLRCLIISTIEAHQRNTPIDGQNTIVQAMKLSIFILLSEYMLNC